MSRPAGGALLILCVGLTACGGGSGSPATPTGVAVGTPASTPTPTPEPRAPEPTPTPESNPNGEPIVFRVTVKVEQVLDVHGDTRLNSPDEGTPIYVGETIRFDATAKDEGGNPTNGSGEIDPGWSDDPGGIISWNHDVGFNPRATAVSPGETWVLASLDGVRSEPIRVVVVPHP